jgi:hypothetical protein
MQAGAAGGTGIGWGRAGKVSGQVDRYRVDLSFKTFLATTEGLLLPDRPSVPGKSRLNMSPYPRSRYRANPHLRPPAASVPRLRRFP